MNDEPPCLVAAIAYARRGWPAFAVRPHSKEPATRRGVKDATLDETELRRQWHRVPEANVGIACGTPGPDVADIDDLIKGRRAVTILSALDGPDVATFRGRQFYVQGTTRGTVSIGFGEVRSRGSYVVAPPSIHPEGKEYTFLRAPTDAPLPALPDGIIPAGVSTAGTGELVPMPLIPFGQRHDALKDYALRILRSGVTDVQTIELMLRAYFAARFDPNPPPRPDEFSSLAVWAARTRMAERERALGEIEDEPKPKRSKRATGLEKPPRGDATLAEHRDFVRRAGGWGDRIDIDIVRRYGNKDGDPLVIRLTNGQTIEFDAQGDITTRGRWARTVINCTNGLARPVAMNELEALAVLRSLCILADAPLFVTAAETMREHMVEFVAVAETWREHDLSTPHGRWEAVKRMHARGAWEPRRGEETPPVVLVDRADGRMNVRAGEVLAWLNARNYKIAPGMLAGRMGLIGAEHWWCRGRESTRPDRPTRERLRTVLFRLPADWTADDDE